MLRSCRQNGGLSSLSAWVFAWKHNHVVGEVVPWKTRLVATGFLQKEGVELLETFSPTPVPSSIRMIAIAALQRDWVLNHWDIDQTFVQNEIDREIFFT